jgi:hypothetical protein
MLFVSTPGMVRFWCRFPSSPSTSCTRTHTLRIPSRTVNRRKFSADASSLHPVSGVFYLEEEDRLIVVLFDGSPWVVGGLRWMWLTEPEVERPRWVSTSVEEESSRKGKEKESAQSAGLEALSTTSRVVFQSLENERREKEKGAVVDRWDMCRINGAVDYDGDGIMGWVYECVHSFCSTCSRPHFFLSHRVGLLAHPISAISRTRNIAAPSSFQRCGRTWPKETTSFTI